MKRLIKKIMQDIRRIDAQDASSRSRLHPIVAAHSREHRTAPPLGFRSRASHSYFVR